MIDMLQVMMFNRSGFCNNGGYDIIKGDLLLRVKNPKGYPLDIRRFTKDWIYDQQTEDSWDDPGAIKFHVGNGGYGNRMCKRFIDKFPFTVDEVNSPLYRIKSGVMDYSRADAGPTSYTWYEPRVMPWGGDVGSILTYPVDYFWSGGKTNREQYFFAPPWGLVKWNHMPLVNGKYVITKKEDDPPVDNKLMSLKDWQKTFPSMTAFSFVAPYMKA